MRRLRRLPQRPEPRDEPSGPGSWGEIECLVVSAVIGGILAVLLIGALYVLVAVGVERFLEWLGPRALRILTGLLGLGTFGAGSIALFRFLTGRAKNVGQYSKTRLVLSCLVFVLAGLFLILVAVLASDTTGF